MRPPITPSPTTQVHPHNKERSASYATIHLAELESQSLSIEESERQISQMIHDFYHPKA